MLSTLRNVTTTLRNARREEALQSFNAAKASNRRRWLEGDPNATEEYIWPNQKYDAANIVSLLHDDDARVVSVQKQVKVGANGLIYQLAYLVTTHSDNNFVVNPGNVIIGTGMSNIKWEKDAIDEAPPFLKNSIFHHGQLKNANLQDIKDCLIIIDEADSGTKEEQVLHSTLKEAGIMDAEHMKENNIRIVIISATLTRELHELYRWGILHKSYKMTIPDTYFGHKDFLENEIIQEFYPLNSDQSANRWIEEDIIGYYGLDDKRIHIVRVNTKSATFVQNACIRNGISFINHTSDARISDDILAELFKQELTKHTVIAVKGFFRRANLIPNAWKVRIGAVHEFYTKKVDNNVQVQGLPGRLCGYWKATIEGGHKVGPIRTSVEAIKEYIKNSEDPIGANPYHTAGFKKDNNGNTTTSGPSSMLSPQHIGNLVPIDLPRGDSGEFEHGHEVFDNQSDNEDFARTVGAVQTASYTTNDDGFKVCSTSVRKVHTLDEIMRTVNSTSNLDKSPSELDIGAIAHRRYVCYKDLNDRNSECYVTVWMKRLKFVNHPRIKKFTSQEGVKEYYNNSLKSRMNGRGPNKVKQDEDGYYRATIRSNKKVYTCAEVRTEQKQGLTENTFRLYPCYENIDDKNTLQWWLIHY